MTITTAQMRGARGILNWSQSDLAEKTGISATSIGSIENGNSQPRESTLGIIQKAFELSGIEFLGRDGVRVRTGEIQTYNGRSGFIEFFDFVYDSLSKEPPRDVLVSNVQESIFLEWARDTAVEHMDRMKEITEKKRIRYKVLLQYGDMDFVANRYAEYKWMKKEYFTLVPFYMFGQHTAIMLFDPEPNILVVSYPLMTEAFRTQFFAMWEGAVDPFGGNNG